MRQPEKRGGERDWSGATAYRGKVSPGTPARQFLRRGLKALRETRNP